MAFEGFQLLAYDYDDLGRRRRTLPLALAFAIPAVTLIYVSVAVAAQLLVADRVLVERKEVALATVGEAALGTTGLVLVSIAALLSTGSAINATLFATARLARDVGRAGELPHLLECDRDGTPWVAVVALGLLAAVFSLMPAIEQVVSFGSLTFLVVFAAVNLLHARDARTSALDRALAWLGAVGCAAAASGLLYHLATSQRTALLVVVACVAVLAPARLVFERLR